MSNMPSSLQELQVAAFQSQLNNVFTAIPCVVVAIRENLSTQMVDIQPAINQKMKDGTVEERPVILGVPVSYPTSKTAGFTFPINVGDTGLAVFSMRNMDAWKSGNGKPSTPMNFAKMDKGDAIFIPGIQPMGMAVNNPAKHIWEHSTQDAVIFNALGTANECEVRLKPSGEILIRTNQAINVECDTASVLADTSVTITTPELNINADVNITGNITHAGNYSQTGNYTLVGGNATFNGIIFNSHIHGASPGPSNP